MDHDTAAGLVTALVSVYDTGLEYYTKWQRSQWLDNHYATHEKGKLCGGGGCGLSTSLMLSGREIRERFDVGVGILGDGFSIGDDRCRGVLAANLDQLQEHIDIFHQSARQHRGALDLFDIIRLSEAVRVSSIYAIDDQYQRFCIGRPVPQEMPVAKRRSLPDVETLASSDVEDDARTARYTSSSTKSPFQSEPPSPPPTPKETIWSIPEDVQSTRTFDTGFAPRPKASVFSLFCPEALKYQVNPSREASRRRNCKRCGYNWRGNQLDDKSALIIKDGFQLSPRFLGKSHCEGGFGCVLCTSSGKTDIDIFESVDSLRDHINAAHDKWQILHDNDLAGN